MRRMSRFESRDAPSASEAHAFFRDPLAWDYVAEEVLPAILARKGEDDAIRVWSAGCGAGEEVYTLAILLCERGISPQGADRRDGSRCRGARLGTSRWLPVERARAGQE
jgi:hypothetical protein